MKSVATATIVILSADAVLLTSLTSLFEGRGHRVSTTLEVGAPPAVEAECVIVDLDRPPNPLSCDWLEAQYPGVPCVILSGSPWSGPHATAGLTCGYFLHKPVAALELTAMVEGLLHDQLVG
jgi:DNA-binding response OmpR family regulator